MTVTNFDATFGGHPFILRLALTVASQSVTANTSTMSWTLKAINVGGYTPYTTDNAATWSFSLDGSGHWGPYSFSGTVGQAISVSSGSFTVAHNSDGTKTLSGFTFAANGASTITTASGSGSMALPTIARATQPTVSPTSGLTGAAYTIGHTPASSAFYHDISYSLDGGSTYTAIASNVVGTTTSTSWTPATTLLPNSTSVTAVIKVATRSSSGGTVIGSKTVNLPLTVPSSVKPSVSSVAWADAQTSAPDIPTLMGAGNFVQRWSKLVPTATALGNAGSTIVSTAVSAEGLITPSGTAFSAAVSTSGAVPYSAITTDSRGVTSDPYTNTVTVKAYNFPILPTPTITRTSDAAGAVPSPTGTYLAITPLASVSSLLFGTEKNLLEWQVRTRPVGGSWTTVQAWTNSTVVGTTWTTKKVVSGYASSTSYDVEISIRDLFGKNGYNTTSTVVALVVNVPTEFVFMDWNQGAGVGIGKYHALGMLDVGGDIYQNGNKVVDTVSVAAALASLIPSGFVMPTATRSAPAGWLLCDGSAVSRTTYASLFSALVTSLGATTVTVAAPGVFTLASHNLSVGDGVFLSTTGALPTGLSANVQYWVSVVPSSSTFQLSATPGGASITTTGTQSGTHTLWLCPYGVGNGSTTFNVPDYRGKGLTGRDTSQAEFAGQGQVGGSKTHLHPLGDAGQAQISIALLSSSAVTVRRVTGSFTSNVAATNAVGGSSGGAVSGQAAALMGTTDASSTLAPYATANYCIKI